MKNLTQVVDKVKEDKQLRPLFLDFIGKNIVMGMTDTFSVHTVDRARIQKDFYDSLYQLSEQLNKGVHEQPLEQVIEEVCKYYLGKVGRLTFERHDTRNEN